MKRSDDGLRLSATDLANHLACPHLTTLELGVAEGIHRRSQWERPDIALLRERGDQHERAYLEHLAARGREIVQLPPGEEHEQALAHTLEAMRGGAEIIVQATLADRRWTGRADVLHRVDRPSALGSWSYEAHDTKLARTTRGGTILQLSLYSDLLTGMQGLEPEFMHVVPPGTGFAPERHRVRDYLAYYRWARGRLERFVDVEELRAGAAYPEPVPHCDMCRWWPRCDRKRRADDHLSFVAGITRLQTRELESRGVTTLESLATLSHPLPWRPARGTVEGFERVRDQARVQREGRARNRPMHELLVIEPGRGLCLLPAPAPGDVFVDLEGDPYVAEGGLEYLFGMASRGSDGESRYERFWAFDRGAERAAFESLVDTIEARRARDPELHVYHYSGYETGAFKRLMCRYATREAEIDRMLRAGTFVDLHAVVRQSLRASVEEYSIKSLEPFTGYLREQPLDGARGALRAFEGALELGLPGVDAEVRDVIERYNRDDCLSTLRLRDWLETLRLEQELMGRVVPRPAPVDGAPREELEGREREVREQMERLTRGVPEDASARDRREQGRWLLAQLLGWHRREEKAPWWEYYRLRDLSDDELLEEASAIAGLDFTSESINGSRKVVHRYRFPRQETSVRENDELHSRDIEACGTVAAIDLDGGTIDIRVRHKARDARPTSVFAHTVVNTRELADSLMRLGRWVADHGIDAPGPYHAARDLLLGLPPRVLGQPLEARGEGVVEGARRLALALDGGVLPIQGPPGSGKTFTGARMICDLVWAGRKVGISAVSHAVIRHLLQRVLEEAEAIESERPGTARFPISCIRKKSSREAAPAPVDARIQETGDNAEVLHALRSGAAQVAGGTAWMWSREEFQEAVDVLFVDEAGQMWLADVLALAPAGKSIVLLGDPQQLEQPMQGTHPEGAAISALGHVLGGHATMPPERGLFLPESWRLHPTICELTSELFYDGRLRSREGLERQDVVGAEGVIGAGLWFLPVEHRGNRNTSPEEVEVVAALFELLTRGGVRWVDKRGTARALGPGDLLVVAPYNAQVADLRSRLPDARVGTVDKFQGQEAPVVLFSMTTSTPEDAPRGMEFLYDLSRFNVATSRARCACVLIGSPRLFEPECATPRAMRLANAFCRYAESAREVRVLEPAPSRAPLFRGASQLQLPLGPTAIDART